MTFSFDQYFSKASFKQRELFETSDQLWDALNLLPSFIHSFHFPTVEHCFKNVVISGNVFIGKNVRIAPFVLIEGPVIIEDSVQIGHGAYIRAHTILNEGVVIGHGAEVKASIIGKGATIAHLSYVGDSILGRGVHLAAHVVCANQRLDKGLITAGAGKVKTSRKKLGALIGDYVSVGCHVVLNPGTIIEKGVKIINKQQHQHLKGI